MKQINKILNCNDKYLYLILSNIDSCDIEIRHSDRPLVTEDFHHPALSIFMQFVTAHTNKSSDHVLKYDFKRADFPSLWYSIREIDWNFLLTFSDVDDAVYNFYNCLDDVFARTFLLKRAVTKKFPFWYSVETRRWLRRKEIVRRLLLRHRNPVFIDEFKSLRTSVKFCIKRYYGNYLHLIEKDLISEPKKFWSHFKKDKNNNHLPDKLYYNDKCFTSDIDIANAYADYFCSVFKPSSEYDSNDAVDFNGFGDFVGIDTITYDDVVVAIKELKSTSTIGIDNIPPFIIKGCAEFLVYPLLALYWMG
ncbi:hypothetical protein AVEN_141527-1 [Araneus ventricosus]|uniref:Uncharacterized protein n=1 Tax=Araneus ventricosus TaxID=182803 RepID=A0A4Y2W2W4_ARAVE|nr:hypothetical protein AVEN_141527-1 [Araneus ventricosus]